MDPKLVSPKIPMSFFNVKRENLSKYASKNSPLTSHTHTGDSKKCPTFCFSTKGASDEKSYAA